MGIVWVYIYRENYAQDIVRREQICLLVLLNKVCLIRDSPRSSSHCLSKKTRAQGKVFVYKTKYVAHTSIPSVGIRVMICIMRQNVKKIPATMVESLSFVEGTPGQNSVVCLETEINSIGLEPSKYT